MESILAGALTAASGAVAAKIFDGPFESLNDLWYANFGYKTAEKRAKREAEVEELKQSLKKELSQIPEENKREPRLCVVGPAMTASKYCIEEAELRSMFAKLIASASDTKKYMYAHPAFANIISQLSPFEAKILKDTPLLLCSNPCCKIRYQKTNPDEKSIFTSVSEGFTIYEHFIIFDKFDITQEELSLHAAVLENLQRLGLCEVPPTYHISDEQLYQKYKNIPALNVFLNNEKHDFRSNKIYLNNEQDYDIRFIKEVVNPTSFGKMFKIACIQ